MDLDMRGIFRKVVMLYPRYHRLTAAVCVRFRRCATAAQSATVCGLGSRTDISVFCVCERGRPVRKILRITRHIGWPIDSGTLRDNSTLVS